ncbi:MAG: nuclear transport factor 2 family protein [archaeon]
MKLLELKSVMKKYGMSWENQDTNLLLGCFTKNGIYRESPHSKPYRGHKAIKKFSDSVVCADTKNVRFKLGKCYVSRDGKTGFAEWECKNTHRWKKDGKWRKDHMVGIMIIKMKGDKITYLNEYWNTKSK